ncbi:MAG: IS3 family transposase, partial [Cytophagaceae bacterium]
MSGFYAWKSRIGSPAPNRYASARAIIRSEFAASDSSYGRRRLRASLRMREISVSTKKIALIMREEGLKVWRKRRFVTTTDSNHSLPVAPNLLARAFSPSAPNLVWVSDITYCWRAGGWSYLAIIKDLCTERIVGWSMSKSIDTVLILRAFAMATSLQSPPAGLIFHSDRGSQYASQAFQVAIARAGFRASMSRKANCWDNAPAESFFARFKQECLQD